MRSGFSTASVLAQADSRPRKAHRVIATEAPAASNQPLSWGFQPAAYTLLSNQNQPTVETSTTGAITPQTVTAPIRPVMLAPPKLAKVVIHNRAIVARPTCSESSSIPNNTWI
ncbi:hypothetical protein D3C71_1510710 [compost metagenome]